MKKSLSSLLAIVLLGAAVPAFAECTIQNFTYTQSANTQIARFTWTPIPGATYTFEEAPGTFVQFPNKVTRFTSSDGRHEVEKRTNFDRTYSFRLIAETADSICRTPFVAVGFIADPALVKAFNRAAIPIVGSTPGANGSNWKTYVRFTATRDNQSARIVFHPAGQPASPGDPEVTLNFAKAGDFREWNDVVPELFHRTGLGTIDIYPTADPRTVDGMIPVATTRIYNDGPQGRFGAFVDQVQPADYRWPGGIGRALTIRAPGPNYRVNIGLRTFEYASVFLVLRGPDGVTKESRSRAFPADQVVLSSVEELLGTPMSPGDTLTISPATGAVVPFYSLTDQSSNDPAYFMTPIPVETSIPWIELPVFSSDPAPRQ